MKDVNWNDIAYETIVRLLGARTGLAFRNDQRQTTKEGIERAMARSNHTDVSEYARLLEFDVDALDNLIVELTVNETYFFREPHHFDYIRSHILPEILERRGAHHTVRIWSAACATGEEAYSLAMLCHQEGLSRQCSILATDISSEALTKAKRATYSSWSLRAEKRMTAGEYLHHDGKNYHVDERIYRMVNFEYLNLALHIYPSFETGTKSLDLILCRNVLIYFDAETIRAVARRFFDSLSVGGWLITASGDPSLLEAAPFAPVVTNQGVFYRRQPEHPQTVSMAPTTATSSRPEAAAIASMKSALDEESVETRSSAGEAFSPQPQLQEAEQALLAGKYQLAVELSEGLLGDPAACHVHLQALANIDTQRAVRRCEMLTERHSLSPDLHYLHAVLLLELNLDVEAVQAIQRSVFLDRSLAMAHFLLGSILQRRGAWEGAQRAFRNARNLCENLPANEPLPLAEDQTAGQLARAAEIQLAAIEAALGSNA